MKKKNNKEEMADGSHNESSGYHVPVLLQESIEALHIRPGGIYVDCTFGGGGHSREILKHLDGSGRLVVFDQDEDAKQNVPDDDRLLFIPQNFRHLKRFLRLHKIQQVDGILADLGVSSHQFDEAERGFSIRFDAALDMRMDARSDRTAADVLNTYPEATLHKLFEQYGEVTNSKTLAKAIVAQRAITPFKTINAFKQSMEGLVKGNPNKYFAQVFQALRIEVNEELKVLEEMLAQAIEVLAPGGRLAVISFHSLEDRLVKNFIKYGSAAEPEADEVFGTRPASPLKAVEKKPVTAGAEELKMNSRSRSAKLRVAEKI
ncbi:MAG: 16S rRNA (cytosine(1402)-N(4))-methyltransferase RsmH [Ferruginibacter sp.]